MLTKTLLSVLPRWRAAHPVIVFGLCALLTVLAGSSLGASNFQRSSLPARSPGLELVVLLDVNFHQEKVLPVELDLAEGVVQQLRQPDNLFSVITFGAQLPTLLKSTVHAEEAVAAIREVRLGRSSESYQSEQLYGALNLAFGQFTDDARAKSLLVVTEGNDYPHGKALEQAVYGARQRHVTCNIAMVADHTFYGSKSIQRYGFYLRRLAGKTHGQYVEVGGQHKGVLHSVDLLSEGIREQDRGQQKALR
jgi:hypothetical protein